MQAPRILDVMKVRTALGKPVVTPGSDAIALASALIRMNTVNPPGDERVAAEFLGELLDRAGFDVAYHAFAAGRTSLVASYGRGTAMGAAGERLCFTGHLDTVPLGSAPWGVPAHGGEIVGNRLYGRGSSDMKAGIAAFVAAALDQVRRRPHDTNLVLVLTAGEETGCEGAHHLAQTEGALGEAGAIVVGEPTANYPLIGHKGVLWLRASTRGVSAHGSTPERGINAAYRAGRLLQKIETFRFGVGRHEFLGEPTISVGTVKSGSNINSVPDLAELGIDIRTVPGVEPAALRRHLADYLAPELAELEGLIEMQPVSTPPDMPWIQRVFHLVAPIIGERPVPRGAGYFTDACALKPAFHDAPTIVLGPGEPDQAHQTDEFCLVSRIVQAVEIYGALIEDWTIAAADMRRIPSLDCVR